MTPGERAIRGTKFRPSSGSVTTFLFLHDKTYRSSRCLHQRSVGGDVHRLGDVADHHGEIEGYLVPHPQNNAFTTQHRKSVLRCGYRVSPGLKGQEMITAIVTRSRRLLRLRIGIDQSNFRTRNSQTRWIADIPGKLDFRRLCVECARQQCDKND